MRRTVISLANVSGHALRQLAIRRGWLTGLVSVYTSDDPSAMLAGSQFTEKLSQKKLSLMQSEFDLNWSKNPGQTDMLITRRNELITDHLVVYITDRQYFDEITSRFKGLPANGADIAMISVSQVWYHHSSQLPVMAKEPVAPKISEEEDVEEVAIPIEQ